MFEPQSIPFFVVLIVAFGAALWWLARARHPILKVVAGCVAFLPAMLFGVAAVNKYYGYYQHWDEVVRDLADKTPQQAGTVPGVGSAPGGRLESVLRTMAQDRGSRRTGLLVSLHIPGPRSGLTRTALVFLPPQYFQPAWANRRLPVLELLHGSPGSPNDWEYSLHVSEVFRGELGHGRARPAILVMPDVNGGKTYSRQCLNTPGGSQDETYLAVDIPAYINAELRTVPTAWGIGGYSEGGYCAANLALRHPGTFGVAGVLSGYFEPLMNRTPQVVDPFAGRPDLRNANTPLWVVQHLPSGAVVPRFWVMAGRDAHSDVVEAATFVSLLRQRVPTEFSVIGGVRHDFPAWRRALPTFLDWATQRLAGPTQGRATTQAIVKLRRAQAPGRGASTVDAGQPAALGATRPPGSTPPATGPRAGTGPHKT